MGSRQIVAHALCLSSGQECPCSRDPMEPACEWQATRADVILHWPLDRRMRLLAALATGSGPTAAPAPHERLAATGVKVPIPAPETRRPEPGPSLNLDIPEAPAPTGPELSDEDEMRRAAGHAWRA